MEWVNEDPYKGTTSLCVCMLKTELDWTGHKQEFVMANTHIHNHIHYFSFFLSFWWDKIAKLYNETFAIQNDINEDLWMSLNHSYFNVYSSGTHASDTKWIWEFNQFSTTYFVDYMTLISVSFKLHTATSSIGEGIEIRWINRHYISIA